MFLTTAIWYKQAFFFIVLILNRIFVVFCYVKVGGKFSVCSCYVIRKCKQEDAMNDVICAFNDMWISWPLARK